MHHIHVTKHRIRNAPSFPMKKPDASREFLEMSLSKEKAILRETAILHDFAGEPLPMAVRELQPLDNTHVEHTIRPAESGAGCNDPSGGILPDGHKKTPPELDCSGEVL